MKLSFLNEKIFRKHQIAWKFEKLSFFKSRKGILISAINFSFRNFFIYRSRKLKGQCIPPYKLSFSKIKGEWDQSVYIMHDAGNSSGLYGLTWLWVSQYLRDGLLYGEVRPRRKIATLKTNLTTVVPLNKPNSCCSPKLTFKMAVCK